MSAEDATRGVDGQLGQLGHRTRELRGATRRSGSGHAGPAAVPVPGVGAGAGPAGPRVAERAEPTAGVGRAKTARTTVVGGRVGSASSAPAAAASIAGGEGRRRAQPQPPPQPPLPPPRLRHRRPQQQQPPPQPSVTAAAAAAEAEAGRGEERQQQRRQEKPKTTDAFRVRLRRGEHRDRRELGAHVSPDATKRLSSVSRPKMLKQVRSTAYGVAPRLRDA